MDIETKKNNLLNDFYQDSLPIKSLVHHYTHKFTISVLRNQLSKFQNSRRYSTSMVNKKTLTKRINYTLNGINELQKIYTLEEYPELWI